jgi:hypothetical protein
MAGILPHVTLLAESLNGGSHESLLAVLTHHHIPIIYNLLLLLHQRMFLLPTFFQKLVFIVNTVDSSSKHHAELHDAQMYEIARLLAIDELET